MARKDRTGNRKTREQRAVRRIPEMGYYLVVTDTEATERCFFNGLHDSLPEDVLSFFLLLCEKGRMPCLGVAISEYTALFDASERISTAKVISAVPLTDGEKAKLKEKLEAMYKRTVNLECSVDENVLGGLIVEVDGNTMDGSLRYRLREVKEVMNR